MRTFLLDTALAVWVGCRDGAMLFSRRSNLPALQFRVRHTVNCKGV